MIQSNINSPISIANINNNKNYHYMSKYTDLQDSSISKFAYTERKSTRSVLGQYDSYEKDYALEKQYLEKLKSQRVKAEKLFEEYTAISKDLKREREINSKLREEIDELRNARSNEVEKGKAEILLLRTETEQQRTDIKTLLADKSTLIKRFKELESELACLDTLREEEEEQRHRVQELEEKLFESTNEFKSEAKEYELKLENLLERNLQLQKSCLQGNKEAKREREQRLKLEQEKNRWQQVMAQKTTAFEKLITNYEEELRIKEKTYEKMVNELQESNKYWTIKYEEKSKEAQFIKKAFEEQKESFRRGREELDSLRYRLQQKERKYETLQKDLSDCYGSIRTKEQELKKIQLSFQTTLANGEKQSGRLKGLQEENSQLKEWITEYEDIIEQKKRRDLQHKQLLQDELEEIKKFERIFKSIE